MEETTDESVSCSVRRELQQWRELVTAAAAVHFLPSCQKKPPPGLWPGFHQCCWACELSSVCKGYVS